ncbi:toprim domain-containing protein [Nocardioides antri]|uniref:toprim domain-containing protein n=1 Tax=Nocardioides antri TaxID=2607659 RepID=UPI00165F2257|nr:toprim domain-containing protein [Nocardioides antri]
MLEHTKYIPPDGKVSFPWRYRFVGEFGSCWCKRKPGETWEDVGIVHPLIYPRDVFARADRRADLLVVEGEADVDEALGAGLLAITAGAAGAFGREHAALVRGWGGRVSIVRDNDLPGAWGAAKAYDALRDVGIPATRLRVARGRVKGKGTDLRDHLEAGYAADDLIAEPIAKVRRLAARATAESFNRAGYEADAEGRFSHRAPRHENDPGWHVVSAAEVAQIRGWRPNQS